jgi:alkylation response protein AidB-like acyl-CoA dehydrogenase
MAPITATCSNVEVGPDFELDDAQQAIVHLAGDVLSDNTDTSERLWKGLGQAGLLGLAVPARLGGAGLGALATGLVLTEIGRHAAAVPALPTLALGVLPVARWGTAEQQRDLLTGVLEGRILTAALAEPGEPMPAAPRTAATAGWTITGTKTGVLDADRAHRVLVPVRRPDGRAAVALVDPGSPGVSLRRTPSSTRMMQPGASEPARAEAGTAAAGEGGSAEFVMRLDGVAGEPLGDDPGNGCLTDLYRFAVAGICALGDGALAGALRMTTDHVRDRHQFGRPLATFQAVAQQIADVYITARTLHLIARAASWGLDARDPARADDDLWTAAYWLSSEALPAMRTCHHLHGGLGLAADYPLHRHSSLARDLVRHLGGAEHCLDQLGGRACSST